MSFFVGFAIGIGLGLGLIVALARVGQSRSQSRTELAAIVAAMAKLTAQDSRKLLPGDFYPSWLVFTQRQKLTWLNLKLDKLWPYINEAASELIRSSVEPTLEEYRPAVLSSLKFSKLTLGTVAPQFTGVCIVEGAADEVIMELEIQWDGNPNIVLDIRTKLGVGVPVQVKDIAFTGLFRLIFKPLVDVFPCFGAVCYSLRENKKLGFKLKVIGGDISTLPGVSDAIEVHKWQSVGHIIEQLLNRTETIRDAIEDSITWPARKIAPILPGDYSDLEPKAVGTLEVKLVQGKELTNKDFIGKSDPFATLFVRPLPSRMKTSKTIDNDLNPIWNEHFEFIVEDVSTQHLTVRIFDDEGVQAAELIGCAQVQLKELEPGKVKGVWLRLVKDLEIQRDTKYRGQVHLELLYCPFGMENVFTNPFKPNYSLTSLEKALKVGEETEASDTERTTTHKKRDIIVRGVLSVTVISAEDLPAVDLMGKADPFVVIRMKKTEVKKKTRVVTDNLNPTWNQTFDLVVEDGLHDMLILEVYDHDTFGKDYIGRCIFTLTRVILEGEFQDSFLLDGAKSGKLHLHLKWTPQPIYRDP